MRWMISIAGTGIALLTGFGLLARYISPATLWPPAIVALLLPVLLFLTFVFAGWNLYRRRFRVALLPVIVCLAAVPILSRIFALARSLPSADGSPTVTITTNNIRGYKNGAWELMSEDRIWRRITSLETDILLLQEARHSGYRETFSKLIKETGGFAMQHQPRKKTVATFATVLQPVSSSFTSSLNGYNGFLVTDVETDIGTLRIINAHLQSNRISGIASKIGQDSTVEEGVGRLRRMLSGYGTTASIRARQAEEIRQIVEESPHPVVVGGDFNDVPSSYTYQRVRTSRLRDAWVEGGFGIGTTFDGPLPFLRIDYLLIDTALTITGVERLDSDFSDHRPLRVTVTR